MYNLTDIGTVKDILGRHGFHFSKAKGQNYSDEKVWFSVLTRGYGLGEDL